MTTQQWLEELGDNPDKAKLAKTSEMLKFDSTKDQVLQSLKELFLVRIKQNKEKRLRQNLKSVKAIREVPRVIWVTRIMAYLSLDECLKLGQACVFFNQIVKSPMFIKFYVTLSEKTKIDVSLSHFGVEGGGQIQHEMR
jgi:FtsZ-binding cell division protein ZapB